MVAIPVCIFGTSWVYRAPDGRASGEIKAGFGQLCDPGRARSEELVTATLNFTLTTHPGGPGVFRQAGGRHMAEFEPPSGDRATDGHPERVDPAWFQDLIRRAYEREMRRYQRLG